MGLDMMMYRASADVETPEFDPNDKGYWDKSNDFYENLTEVAYWRKFNALHSWLVQNVQDGQDHCQYSDIEPETLQEVLDLLQESLDTKEALIEPQGGFFFGSTNVDDYYWSDVESAIEQISKILEDTDFDTEKVIYSASW